MVEREKCVVSTDAGRMLNPCSTLSDLVTRKHHGLGVDYRTIFNIKTLTFSRELWILRSGKHAKNGIVLNFCPMCGESLMELLPPSLTQPDTTPPDQPRPLGGEGVQGG